MQGLETSVSIENVYEKVNFCLFTGTSISTCVINTCDS